VGDEWFSRRRQLRRALGRLAFVLIVWIYCKFFRRLRNGNSFTLWNRTESRWYILIHYCPLLFLCDAYRNRWHHTEEAVSCVITSLPPNHRNSKWHRMSFANQPLWKICWAFTSAYVRGPIFVLVTDLVHEIQMICHYHYRGDGDSLPCKRHHRTCNKSNKTLKGNHTNVTCASTSTSNALPRSWFPTLPE
jgi:hypothetical protein